MIKPLTIFLFVIIIINSNAIFAQNHLNVNQIDYNREAVTLNRSALSVFPHAHTGFRWNKGDNNTKKWRPQGICGMVKDHKKYVIVSWYGRKQANYQNRGARISVVDVTSMEQVKYRHILLLDAYGNTLRNLHAGGLVYKNGELHVPDSRNSNDYKVHTFNMNQIIEVNPQDYYNYRYVLKATGSYAVPIKPSFMSYDWDKDKILIGSFHKCRSYHSDDVECILSNENRLSWYKIGQVNKTSDFCAPFLSEMQGAASMNFNENHQIIWISCSYGRYNESHLHALKATKGNCYNSGVSIEKNTTFIFPPGLEDLHLAKTSSNLWLLTEFGPHEGSNNRVVFAINRNKILP